MNAACPALGRRAVCTDLGRLIAKSIAMSIAVSLAASFVGCASSPPLREAPPLTAAGRLGVRVEASPDRAPQSLSAAFEWRGNGERGELTLFSPLGTQVAQARWSPGEAWLLTPDGQTRFDTLEALAARALGEAVPLHAWPDWLAGRPWAGAPSAPLVSSTSPAPATATALAPGPVRGFEQLGWSVDLSRYGEGRIDARRGAPPVVTVRIVLDNEGQVRQ